MLTAAHDISPLTEEAILGLGQSLVTEQDAVSSMSPGSSPVMPLLIALGRCGFVLHHDVEAKSV